MALASTLPELFFARLLLGAMGAASTLAFIMAGRTPESGDVRRRVATLQSASTVGQVIGPLVGAIAAARLGIRGSFVLGGAILLGCATLVHWAVPRPSQASRASTTDERVRPREIAAVSLIVLGGAIPGFFFTATLPPGLTGFGVGAAPALAVRGPARIGAGFVGPVVATTLLAWTSPGVLYGLLAAIGLACVPLVRTREAGTRA